MPHAGDWSPPSRSGTYPSANGVQGQGEGGAQRAGLPAFEELKGELSLVLQKPDQSLARHKFFDECEAAINEQIKLSPLQTLALVK